MLAEIRLNEGLQIIEGRAFHCCSSLQSVTLPSTVTRLCGYAFGHCRSLVEIKLNEGLKVVGDYAFARCAALRSVTLPSNVTVLGEGAFHR